MLLVIVPLFCNYVQAEVASRVFIVDFLFLFLVALRGECQEASATHIIPGVLDQRESLQLNSGSTLAPSEVVDIPLEHF